MKGATGAQSEAAEGRGRPAAGAPRPPGADALVVIGVLNSAISVYYYLRLIVVMFFRERTTQWQAPRIPASIALVLILTVAGVLFLGIFPGSVIDAFRTAQPSDVTRLR